MQNVGLYGFGSCEYKQLLEKLLKNILGIAHVLFISSILFEKIITGFIGG